MVWVGKQRLAHRRSGWYAEMGRKGEQAAERLSARFSVGGGSKGQAAVSVEEWARFRWWISSS
jgi:hypothetical protein